MDDIYTRVYEKFSTLQRLMKRSQAYGRMEAGSFSDKSHGQGRILAMLKIQPEISTRDLSYLLGIRQQSLNEQLNKLEEGEYVTRQPSEKDKRVMVVHLTEKGKATKQQTPDYQEVLDCLTADELEQMEGYLDRIIAALEKRVEDGKEKTVMADWMEKARERMGNEPFEKLMAMRERAFGGFGRKSAPENAAEHATEDAPERCAEAATEPAANPAPECCAEAAAEPAANPAPEHGAEDTAAYDGFILNPEETASEDTDISKD